MTKEKLLRPGKWYSEFDENGNCTKTVYEASYRKLLGFETEKEYANAQETWINSIFPEDKERLNRHLKECLSKHPEGMDYDIEYRMMTQTGYRWFHDYGHCTRSKDGTLIRCDGVVFDIQNTMDKEEAHQKLLLQNREIISGLASEYLALYYINLKDNTFRIFSVDDERLSDTKKLLTKDSDGFTLLRLFAHSAAVHPDDRKLFDNVISKDGMVAALVGRKKYTIRFRRNYGHGYLWSIMDIIKYEDADEEANAVVVGFAERDKEIRQEMADEVARKSSKIIDSIIINYATAYVVNVNDDSYRVLKYDEKMGRKYAAAKFSTGIRAYIENDVHPNDRERLLAEIDTGVITEKLKNTQSYRIEFRALVDGVSKWHEIYITSVSEEEEILIAVAERDDDILYQHIEEVMTARFEGIYIADWNINKMKIQKGTGGFKQFEGKMVPWRETMQMFSSNLTGDDKIFFRDVYGEPDVIRQVLTKEKDIEYYYLSPNYGGDPIWMKSEVHTLTWDENGVPETAMVGISQVDSQQREKMQMNATIAEQKTKLEEQQQQLQEALTMAQSANRAKTTFLNNMSHDIRTPMNAIIGYTGLASKHLDNKEQVQDYLSKISQSSDHLLSLINDVLDMSRIESGKMHLDEKEENLSDIIHTLRNIVQADVHSKRLNFFVDAVDINNEDIICDKLRLNQVLLNILSNSIKYTQAGGTVSMYVAEKAVKPNGTATFEFRIKDNGMGMDKEFLKLIYDPFTRVQSSTVSGIQGTGLGMAITKNIVDMMGGSIDIDSVPNQGTEVTMTFDFRLQNAPKVTAQLPKLEGIRVLVVDDDSDTCLSICNMLKPIGMRYQWCTSGKEAVIRAEAAKSDGEPFELVILDWLMPDMNGLETTRRIRRVIGKDVPIVVLTAYDWSDADEEAKDAGVTEFTSKPMFPSDLSRVLLDCFGKPEGTDSGEPSAYNFTGKKVLLVEDNEMNREISTEILAEAGFIIDTAEDGSVAVEKMKTAKVGDYDLVLMDIQMPLMNGYEATKQIRALRTELSRIPILAMTANAFEEDRKAALEAGMNEHIAKPIDIAKLKETMEKFL